MKNELLREDKSELSGNSGRLGDERVPYIDEYHLYDMYIRERQSNERNMKEKFELKSELDCVKLQLEEARGIIEVVVEVNDDDCYYDHHGYCQAHNLEEDCHVARAKKWLKENK